MAGNTSVEYVLSLKDLFTPKIKEATKDTNLLNASVGKTQSAFNSLGGSIKGALIGAGVAGFTMSVVNATAAAEGLRNQMNFASGSIEQGGKDFEFVRERAKYLGLDLQTTAQAFASLEGATRGTSIAGQQTRDIFEGVAEASTVMHLTTEQSSGALLALQQMMSKGKVSAEELNGQLGERIPGALGIASRAMNMTTADLMAMMQSGKLLSTEFLPKFANQLKKEFAGGVETARQSLQASLNNMSTAWFEFQVTLGELVYPAIVKVLHGLNSLLEFGGKIAKFVSDNALAFKVLAGAIAGAATAVLLYNTYIAATKVIMGVQFIAAIWGMAAALEGVTVAQWLLNTATAFFAGLSGVGLFAVAAAGAAALAVGIYAATSAQKSLNSEISKTTKPISTLDYNKNSMGAATGSVSPNISKQSKSTGGGTSTSSVEARQSTNFNITIDKLVEKLNVTTNNMKEGSAEIKSLITKALVEATNDFQLMSTK